MQSRILYTEGNGKFNEGSIDIADIKPTQIRVKSKKTGVCRSDIDMMNGNFGPLPLHMQGHEGLGEVLEIGADVTNVSVGDYVATRGEPAYADFYNADAGTYVKVPSLDSKYIVEPVACGLNVVMQEEMQFETRHSKDAKVCIIGSGFLAWVVYQYLTAHYFFKIDVIGQSNKERWGDKLKTEFGNEYDIVIDLNTRDEVFKMDLLKPQGLIVLGAEKTKTITTNFDKLLWNAVTVVFPSPRQKDFVRCMNTAVKMIESGQLNVDNFWTKSYNRDNEWQSAFAEGNDRQPGYSRGYIEWC
jgi:D-arabinose 1-dehydrogenase-like Zn-dependent alcohol dehydrogenase|tara:strand:+ start:1983 stop:2882 length:900 start_codon:yes stop_codon:yes gene_type:complete